MLKRSSSRELKGLDLEGRQACTSCHSCHQHGKARMTLDAVVMCLEGLLNIGARKRRYSLSLFISTQLFEHFVPALDLYRVFARDLERWLFFVELRKTGSLPPLSPPYSEACSRHPSSLKLSRPGHIGRPALAPRLTRRNSSISRSWLVMDVRACLHKFYAPNRSSQVSVIRTCAYSAVSLLLGI